MAAKNPKFVIVVDQGSRRAPPVVDNPEAKALIIDHHLSDEFPENATVCFMCGIKGVRGLTGAQVVSACHYPPVATSALLTYEICKTLHPDIEKSCAYLCAMGTHGDLGTTLKWKPPFPDMAETFKVHSKKAINDAVALINAPRRTAKFDVISAWEALLKSQGPKEILTNERLLDARAEINAEVERQTHTPPKFSKDGKIAVLRIHSAAQVHPVIATRWVCYSVSGTVCVLFTKSPHRLATSNPKLSRSSSSRTQAISPAWSTSPAASLAVPATGIRPSTSSPR